LVIFIGLFPWSVFLGPALVQFLRGIRRESVDRAAYILLACWIAAFFGFWSLCSTKLPHYVLPAYPPLAILIACFIQAWRERPEAFSLWWPRLALTSLFVVGLGMIIVLPWAASRYVPGDEAIAAVGAVLASGAAAGLVCLTMGRLRMVLPICAMTSIAFIVAMFGWALVRIDGHQHSKPLMAAMMRDCRESHQDAAPQLAGYRFLQASTVYYAGGPVPEYNNTDALRAFFASAGQPYIVTTSEFLPELEHCWPGGFREVARMPEFLHKSKAAVEVVVVAPTESMRVASHGAGTRLNR
jgi:4-amino-4-deoxy-L-arabinose transferase-like glycosyltransferase